ncbi:MAG: bifunctional methylenetetrahydrofolate dehydrogenase/methenyltetrahydrofolate cyclohydrolase FolD [Ruminococcaceae bacterium]|nr:bifunctional methylenetetrahydrofolate dehydrogenase/methenyltetrahydrofolate cyclohydrolase FolD [Oscillospiraceae bacterium]
MSTIMDGKALSCEIRAEIKAKIDSQKEKGIEAPSLAVVLVGNDPASKIYVRNKKNACAEAGITSYEYTLPETATEEEVLALIEKLNCDEKINGILVQVPLPKGIDEKKVIDTISPEKDVDAFSESNIGKYFLGNAKFLPCTPGGILHLLDKYEIDVNGKNCVVIGRSNIVGKPMALLLLQRNGTVTVCHSRTKNLEEYTKNADIIIVAIGKPKFLTGDMIKEGAVVIDVGINRLPDGKVTGDADFESCKEKASFITPVPGGVGPMTIAQLLLNTLEASNDK